MGFFLGYIQDHREAGQPSSSRCSRTCSQRPSFSRRSTVGPDFGAGRAAAPYRLLPHLRRGRSDYVERSPVKWSRTAHPEPAHRQLSHGFGGRSGLPSPAYSFSSNRAMPACSRATALTKRVSARRAWISSCFTALALGDLGSQAEGELGLPAGEAGDQGDARDQHGKDRDHHRERQSAPAPSVTSGAVRKRKEQCRAHRGVVHAGDRATHHRRGDQGRGDARRITASGSESGC